MSKREEVRAKRRRQKRMQAVFTVGAVVVFSLLILAFLAGPTLRDALFPPEIPAVADWETLPRPSVNRNSMGDPDAPIKIEEFSDFQCPYCGRFSKETEPLIVENYVKTGKVYFTYRSMGNWISQNIARATGQKEKSESRDAAMSMYCAADQGKFWEMHDGLFANDLGEDVGSFTRARLRLIAEKAGLNLDEFDACLSSEKYLEQANRDYQDGMAAGVNGTPSFLLTYTVNGEVRQKLIEGAQPFSVFQAEIEAILAEMAAQ
jgi:protein-disulfide isomerase